MPRLLALLSAGLLLSAAAGCSGTSQNAPGPAVTQLEAAAADALLTTEIKAKLITVDVNSATAVGVRVSEGTATLTGTVRSPAVRAKAVAATRKVGGIRRVVDRLRVDPHQPDVSRRLSDAALSGRIAAAIFTQTGATGVKVDVHDGNVVLSGNVTDPRVRTAAVDTARNTSGVKSVTDNMGLP